MHQEQARGNTLKGLIRRRRREISVRALREQQTLEKLNQGAMKRGALRLDVRRKRVPIGIFRNQNRVRNPRRNLRSQKSFRSVLARGKNRRDGHIKRSWKNKKGETRKYDEKKKKSRRRERKKPMREEGTGRSRKRKRHESEQRGRMRMNAGKRSGQKGLKR
jgi:hypothetical protein